MQKPTTTSENPWDTQPEAVEAAPKETKPKKNKTEWVVTPEIPAAPAGTIAGEYDLEGLMTDFPTATDLERFVYDQTGTVLNLKGRANKLKYQIAMDVLNGQVVEQKYLGNDNPYVDRTEMIPEEALQPRPDRDAKLPPQSQIQNTFWLANAPHPDADARARDKKCHLMFRKYKNGMISYEIEGPLEQYAEGTKIDKYGRERPEIMKWLDPRTGEQIAVREDGTLTPQGKRLRAMMQGHKVNNSNYWDVFVDREFITLNDSVIHNPWDIEK